MAVRLGYLRFHALVLAIFMCGGQASACYVCASNAKETALIRKEWAVIFWDPDTHVEQLIWMIDFRTDARSLTLLVPTPTVPELMVVDPAIFRMARDVAAPKLVPPRVRANVLQSALVSYMGLISLYRDEDVNGSLHHEGLAGETVAPPSSDKPDFTATLLDAADPVQVPNWLNQNGFGWKDDYNEWLARYSLKDWHISAFKFTTRLSGISDYQTAALKFTFKTEQPFFPYREFEDLHGRKPVVDSGRKLNLTYLSDTPVTGCLEEGIAWPAVCKYMGNAVPDAKNSSGWSENDWLKLTKLKGVVTEPAVVSHFVDESNPRPGNTDLFFSPTANLEPYQAEQTDFSARAVYYFEWRDYLSIPVVFILPALLSYIAVRCWQKANLISEPSGSTSQISVHPWLQNVDSIIALITAILGFLFMASFAIFPAFFLIQAVALVNKHPGNSTTIAPGKTPRLLFPQNWRYRLYSILLLGAALLYLALVVANMLRPIAVP